VRANGTGDAEPPIKRWTINSGRALIAPRFTSTTGVSMKRLSLVAILAVLTACTQGPTQPDIQSTPRFSRNPAGTGQPGAECGEDNALTEPTGFGTGGFGIAEAAYAGSDGTPSLNSNNSHAVSQYDVACYQVSNR
jgi:hypothetical protein